VYCQERGTTATPRTTTGAPSASGSAATTSSGHSDVETVGVGPIVETAIQRSPILYIRNGSVRIGLPSWMNLMHRTLILHSTLIIQYYRHVHGEA